MDNDHDELATMQMKANQITDEVSIYMYINIIYKFISS